MLLKTYVTASQVGGKDIVLCVCVCVTHLKQKEKKSRLSIDCVVVAVCITILNIFINSVFHWLENANRWLIALKIFVFARWVRIVVALDERKTVGFNLVVPRSITSDKYFDKS